MKDISKEHEVYIELIRILTDLVNAYKEYSEALEDRLSNPEREDASRYF